MTVPAKSRPGVRGKVVGGEGTLGIEDVRREDGGGVDSEEDFVGFRSWGWKGGEFKGANRAVFDDLEAFRCFGCFRGHSQENYRGSWLFQYREI